MLDINLIRTQPDWVAQQLQKRGANIDFADLLKADADKRKLQTTNDELKNKRYRHIIEQAREYIANHYADEDISLKDIARYVNVSPSHFSAMFSRETGQGIIQYLTKYRMDKAKELLQSSDIRCAEVGAAVGYKDPHYFSYLFKKTQKCSPMQYRAQGAKHS